MTTSPHATDTPVARRDRRAFSAETTERLTWLLDTMTRDLSTERHARRKATLTRQTGIIREVLAERDERITTDAAELAIITARAAALDALPTDDEVEAGDEVDALVAEVSDTGATEAPCRRCGLLAAGPQHAGRDGHGYDPEPAAPSRLMVLDGEHAEHLVAAGVDVRTVGRELWEVTVKGVAAGRVMLGDTSWHGYDLAGRRVTGLGVDTLAAAVEAVVALGATPDRPHGSPAERLARRYGLPVVEVVTVVDEVLDEVLDGTPVTDALDERPRPLDAGEVATAVATWGGRLGAGPAALALLVGTTDSSARDGSNASHLVVDTETWRARCGKTIAEAYEVTGVEAITCESCRRGALIDCHPENLRR